MSLPELDNAAMRYAPLESTASARLRGGPCRHEESELADVRRGQGAIDAPAALLMALIPLPGRSIYSGRMLRAGNTRDTGGRPGPLWLKLLLVPLLLFGFSAMHTLGHAEGPAHGNNHAPITAAGEHNAAPWGADAAEEALPDLDPTDTCPVLSGFPAVKPASTTVVAPWPQAPPRRATQVRAFDPTGVEAENKPSLDVLQVLRI